jgi:hypothetical protein
MRTIQNGIRSTNLKCMFRYALLAVTVSVSFALAQPAASAASCGGIVIQLEDGTRANCTVPPLAKPTLRVAPVVKPLPVIPVQALKVAPALPPVQAPALIENPQLAIIPVPSYTAPTLPLPSGSKVFGQPTQFLSDSEVNQAIAQSQGRQPQIGLVLRDIQTGLLTAMACRTCAVSGYSIHVYTPEQWIRQMAVNAHREMLPFSEKDVTQDMRQRLLHVVAMPSTPAYLTGTGFGFASSVHRIVLTDMTRQVIIQPIELGNGVVETNSALRSANFSNAHAAFVMSDVDALRASDGKHEFFITVTGDRQNKFFRVKERFFKTLFN